jgi:two-component system NtrC family sensor kinase
VVIFTGVSSILIGYFIIIDGIINQAYSEIKSYLNSAQYVYSNKINVIHIFMDHLASLTYVQEAIVANNRMILIRKLQEVRNELSLDILNITDTEGNIIVRARNPEVFGDRVDKDILVNFVLENRKPCLGSDLMQREYLKKEGNDLADQAFTTVVKTPHARKDNKRYEERGLVLKAASPIYYQDRFIGVIYGARLINHNYDIVDRIQQLVFKDEKINGWDVGTSTIFLDDVRISTNVRNKDNTRAIGTQVSEEVYNQIFFKREMWLAKAFVVNNWYYSAYAPIFNIQNKVIGILYVGLLEEKYSYIMKKTYLYFLLVTLISAAIAIVLSLYFIRSIIAPYRDLIGAAQRITRNDYTKIPIAFDDEIGYISKVFNRMIDAIVIRDQKLKEQTEKQINQSEKLASLGRLASGIAHEINNPLTGILTYSSILLEDFKGTDFQEDLQVVVNETMRCRNIVKGILDFARETKLEKEKANINSIIVSTLAILENHLNFHNIEMHKELSPEVPDMNLDINQMKSVINNCAVNAADAMPNGGTFSVTTEYIPERKVVVIKFKDTGIGIPEENIPKIFDPFFTTKDPGKGTGLGMAVTYGIIKRHNGTIEIRSTVGTGTTFIVELPVQ